MEKTYTTAELIAFSREWTLMRERANDILQLIRDEDAIHTRLDEVDYINDADKWIKIYDGIKSLQKRIKLKINAFVRRHYGEGYPACIKGYVGIDYVDMIFKFFDLIKVYGINGSLK